MRTPKELIRGFLGRYFRARELADDEDVFALGFVNSLLALQLVDFLEREFAITIEDQDLDLDNFRSIDRMVALVERKAASPEVREVAHGG